MEKKDNSKYFPSKKDFERMIDLIDKKSNGAGVAKVLKDKDKAIGRWVAGVLLKGAAERWFPKLTFPDFYKRAIELGATEEELGNKLMEARDNYDKDVYKVKKSINYIDYILSKEGLHIEEEKQNARSRNRHELKSNLRWNIRTLLKIYDDNGHYVFLDYDNVVDDDDLSRWHDKSIYELFNVAADNVSLLRDCMSSHNISDDNRYRNNRFKMCTITAVLEDYFKEVSA